MLLSVTERFVLAELLPPEENYAGMVEINKARANLALSGDEAIELEVVQAGDRVNWNPEKAQQHIVDVPMGEWMIETIRGILRSKNDEHKLEDKLLSLYEKFVLDYEQL